MRYVTIMELLTLHRRIIEQSGGDHGVRDPGLAESALAQPQITFDGLELHTTIQEKAAALCFSLIMNHPFIDGNKRIGHAAMETFLILNGFELNADVDDSEQVILQLAASQLERQQLLDWVAAHMTPLHPPITSP